MFSHGRYSTVNHGAKFCDSWHTSVKCTFKLEELMLLDGFEPVTFTITVYNIITELDGK